LDDSIHYATKTGRLVPLPTYNLTLPSLLQLVKSWATLSELRWVYDSVALMEAQFFAELVYLLEEAFFASWVL
jgi:hypothetical protein